MSSVGVRSSVMDDDNDLDMQDVLAQTSAHIERANAGHRPSAFWLAGIMSASTIPEGLKHDLMLLLNDEARALVVEAGERSPIEMVLAWEARCGRCGWVSAPQSSEHHAQFLGADHAESHSDAGGTV